MAHKNPTMSVFAPLTGKVVDISEIKDEAYSKKHLGDGVAIIPEEGTVFSPVSGIVTSVATETNHAFSFQTEDGVEIMVQVGINTESVDISAYSVYVKEGQRVQAGDLVAEVDLNKITMKGCDIATPVIICGGVEGFVMHPGRGHVVAGAGAVFTLEDFREAAPEELAKAEAKAVEERGGTPAIEKKEEKKEKAEAKAEDKAAAEEKAGAKKKGKAKKKSSGGESITDFINAPGGLLKAGLALLIITVLMVACFVSVAMFTMSE